MSERVASELMLMAERAFRNESRMKEALQEIWNIVHTPTKDTAFRNPADHFASDFDAIRKIIKTAQTSC